MKDYKDDQTDGVYLRDEDLSSHVYENYFPHESNSNKKSLLSSRALDTWFDRLDYNKLLKSLFKGSWFPVMTGLIVAVLIYSFLPGIYPKIDGYQAQVSLLYKKVKRDDPDSLPMATVKEMITMPQNCQGVKTLLGIESSLDDLQDKSSVEITRNSNLMELVVESNNREEAINLANTFAEVAYNNNKKFYEDKAKLHMNKSEVLSTKARSDLVLSQNAYVSFKRKYNLVDIDLSKKNLLDAMWNGEATLDELRRSLALYSKEKSYMEQLLKDEPETVKISDENQASLKQELLATQMLYIQLKVEYAGENPKLVQLKEKIASLKKSIAHPNVDEKNLLAEVNPQINELKASITNKQNQIEDVENQIAALSEMLAKRQSALKNFPALQQEHNRLLSEMLAAEKLVEFHEENLRTARIDFVRPRTDFEIYELATDTIEKDKNTRSLISAVMGFGGTLFAFGLMFTLYTTKNRVSTTKELELNYTSPCLVSIPQFKEKELKMIHSPMKTYIQVLSEKVALKAQYNGSMSLAVSSSAKGVGKSSIALELAKYYAGIGLKTVYLDFDYLGKNHFEHTSNITDVLHMQESYPVKDILPEQDNLTMVKFDQSHHMHESLKSPSCQHFMDGLKKNYDVIILDTPGVLEEAYACNTIKLANNCLFIVKAGSDSKEALDKAMHRLEEMCITPIGFVLNEADKGDY